MLNILVNGYRDDCIKNVTGYFNINKQKDWFNRGTVKKIIKDIDNTDAIKDEYLESPVFGAISPERLSTGCKAVILLDVLGTPNIYATKCGDNCVDNILEISKRKDITITLHHCITFPKSGFEAKMLESGKIVSSNKEFIDEYYRIKHQIKSI